MSGKHKKQLIEGITLGADIEVFLQHRESNVIVSAEGIIKGTKEEPFKFDALNNYFATSLDNVLAEFCIPPSTNSSEFVNNIIYAKGWIEGYIPKHLKILATPAATLSEMYLQTPNAKKLGCEPDYNAWLLGEVNPTPQASGCMRSAGGHIHIGYKKPNMNVSMSLIKAMDIYLGLPSILQEPDNERKKLYGKAGAFRFKPYGVEYRTISNYYINQLFMMEWVYNNTMEAIEFVNRKSPISIEEAEAVQAAINFDDKTLAKTMCDYFGVKLAA